MKKREEYLEIINDANSPKDIKEMAQKQLDKLDSLSTKDESQAIDKDIKFAVDEFTKSVDKLLTQGLDKKEVAKIVEERMSKAKFSKDNLDSGLLELIGKTQTVQIVNWEQIKVKTSDGKKRKIFDLMLSDFEAGNNVYLYGGAGTGKTYIAGQVAKSLNYKLITLNCNQFTSPLDIVGGQTIDGYQEGRLTEAFGNLFLPEINPKTGKEYSGAVLLLDELPKLDPNTAGVLNDGLSKVKDPIEWNEEGTIKIFPDISNGRGQKITRKKIFVIATGNSLLNEADVDYEANFKQDLSLQDRFAGSTYELIIDPQYELDSVMSNIDVKGKLTSFTFIFNFLFLLRQAVERNNYQGRAFVSMRLMISFRDTYIAYRLNEEMGEKRIRNSKTLQIATDTFLDLFTTQQRAVLEQEVNKKEFFDLIDEKNKLPLNKLVSDTDKGIATSLIEKFNEDNKGKIK